MSRVVCFFNILFYLLFFAVLDVCVDSLLAIFCSGSWGLIGLWRRDGGSTKYDHVRTLSNGATPDEALLPFTPSRLSPLQSVLYSPRDPLLHTRRLYIYYILYIYTYTIYTYISIYHSSTHPKFLPTQPFLCTAFS